MKLAAIYIRELREKRGISRAHVARQITVHENTLWRVESGRQQPSGPLLVALINAVDGRIDHVVQLLQMRNDPISEVIAHQLVAERLEEIATIPEADEIMERLSRSIHKLRAADPARLGLLAGYAARLLDELRETE